MKKFVTLAASTAVSLAALTGVALADDHAGKAPAGWYVSGGLGYNIIDDVDVSGGSFQMDDGYVIQAAVGYDTGDVTSYGKFRVEAEIGYAENDNDTQTPTGGAAQNIGGNYEQTSFLVNGYVDFLPGSNLRPYLGVGLGFIDGEQTVTSGGLTASGSGTEFAYRGAAGVSWHLADKWALDLGYRYTAFESGGDVESHSFITGIRYGF